MRRLAKHSREDKYSSRRDYQTIRKRQVSEVEFRKPDESAVLVLHQDLKGEDGEFLGFAAYIKPSHECKMRVTLGSEDGILREGEFSLDGNWNRLGVAGRYLGVTEATVEMTFWKHLQKVDLWGVDCGIVELPKNITVENLTIEDLESPYICPETLYQAQSTSLNMDIVERESSEFSLLEESQEYIELKKCSYCGRYLPLDSSRPGALAFHKHNAKRTGHQNECRACKKWRINDVFNPRRTVDQLSESSLITRERKIFLREPEILQRIKDRRGAGLKSIVWKRFGKCCFNCKKPLKLSQVKLDHTRPLAYLWPIDEYATCLCDECNNFKKDHFPVDIYTEEQMHDLAEITGLSYDELAKKGVNETEVKRITDDIVRFSISWDPRTFNATRRKIKEFLPDLDLLGILKKTNPEIHKRLRKQLRKRPGWSV